MGAWWEGPLVGFDTETTGVDVTQDRIVTASLLTSIPGERTRSQDWLIDPGVEIPEAAAAVHGITTEKARAEGVGPLAALDYIANELNYAARTGWPIVAFNASFDLSILDHELARHGLPSLADRLGSTPMTVIDPLVIDRHVDRYRRGKRTLTAACQVYGVTLDDAHTADADAAAAVELARKLGAAFPEISDLPAGVLHGLQVKWFKEQAEGLQAYFDRQGKRETVNTLWPIRPVESIDPLVAAIYQALDEHPELVLSIDTNKTIATTAAEAARRVLQGAAA